MTDPTEGSKPIRRRRHVPHRIVTVVAIVLTATISVNLYAAEVSAEGRSSSHVVGRGDILTTILLGGRGQRTARRSGTAPRCRDRRLSDAQIEMLTAAISWVGELQIAQEYAQVLSEYLDGNDGANQASSPDDAEPDDSKPGENLSNESWATDGINAGSGARSDPGYDIMARWCDNAVTDIWLVPATDSGDLVGQITRRMVTRLPQPIMVQSPPVNSAVPVGTPVFITIDKSQWHPIHATLRANAMTVEVRAEPTRLRMFTGEPGSQYRYCDGPGRTYDSTRSSSARAQSQLSGACAVNYDIPSLRAPVAARPWLGSVSVLWRTEWRVNGGSWISLGTIPRTQLFERRVVELTTPITRTFFPIPQAGR